MNLDFFSVARFCAGIDRTQSPVVIDCRTVNWIEPFALMYLGMFIRLCQQAGGYVRLDRPLNPSVDAYLRRQNFYERFGFQPAPGGAPIHRLSASTSLGDMVDIIASPSLADEAASSVACILDANGVAVDLGYMQVLVAELVDNFVQHADPYPYGAERVGSLMMQFYPQKRLVTIAIGDCGIGIRASLSSNPQYASLAQMHHADVTLMAMRQGVTSRVSGGGGTGFTEVQDTIRELQGVISVATGDGYVVSDGKGMRYGPMAYDLRGVHIQARIPCWR